MGYWVSLRGFSGKYIGLFNSFFRYFEVVLIEFDSDEVPVEVLTGYSYRGNSREGVEDDS